MGGDGWWNNKAPQASQSPMFQQCQTYGSMVLNGQCVSPGVCQCSGARGWNQCGTGCMCKYNLPDVGTTQQPPLYYSMTPTLISGSGDICRCEGNPCDSTYGMTLQNNNVLVGSGTDATKAQCMCPSPKVPNMTMGSIVNCTTPPPPYIIIFHLI